MDIALVKFDEKFLHFSWKWLNDPEIRELTNATIFTKAEQDEWFRYLNEKEDYKIWGLIIGNKHVGACGLKKITKMDCEYWGYIGEKEFWGRGYGSEILRLIENEAAIMKLTSVWLQVSKSNKRAISLYQKHGYLREKDEGNILIMRKKL